MPEQTGTDAAWSYQEEAEFCYFMGSVLCYIAVRTSSESSAMLSVAPTCGRYPGGSPCYTASHTVSLIHSSIHSAERGRPPSCHPRCLRCSATSLHSTSGSSPSRSCVT